MLGIHIDGGLSEFILVPLRKLHSSSSLTADQFGEPLRIGAHAVARAQLHAGEEVLVIGTDPIGLSVVQFALLAGAGVTVLDTNESRLHFCQER